MAAAWRSCKLTAGDESVINHKLRELASTLGSYGFAMSDSDIQDAVAEQRKKLEEDKKRFKWQTRAAKKHRVNVNGLPRELVECCKDWRSDSVGVVNLDYLARVDSAMQTILNHRDFRDVVDQLPMEITGVPVTLTGVQARYAQIRRVFSHCACHPVACPSCDIHFARHLSTKMTQRMHWAEKASIAALAISFGWTWSPRPLRACP